MPTLTIQLPGLPSVEHIVREDAITLGRMKGNSISLNESSVSLSHAKITRVGNDFFLKDLNSTNGTMLNGQSITEARLRDGDQLKLGEVIAYFRLEPLSPPAASADPATPPPPKPVAQSVPAPVSVPSPVPPASPSPGSAMPRSALVPPLPERRQKSSRWPLFLLGGVAGLVVIGFLAWKYFISAPALTATAPPVAQAAVPQKLPGSQNPDTKTAGVPVLNLYLASLTKKLKSPDAAVRRQVASEIYKLGPAEPLLPALTEALKDTDPEVRMWAALALVHNNVFDKATIAILLQTLHHENPKLRQVACLSLAMVVYSDADKEPVIAALMDTATKDASPEVANDALTALKIIAPGREVGK
jgi:hypothetical protein